MDAILNTVLPVFGMIVLGYGFARANIVDAAAARGIAQFVFNVAIPALLFRTVAIMAAQEALPWGLWLVFFSGLAVTWIAGALLSRHLASLSPSGGAAASMAAGFGNLALLGTPLALAHFGNAAAVPLGMILSIHAPILWFAATMHREFARHSSGFSLARTARELFLSLAGNAIVLALIAGSLWRMTGLGLHPVAGRMLEMLSDASVPTALFALGLSLAGYSLRGQWGGMLALIGLKMVLMPVLVFIAVRYVVALPPLWAKIAVLFAAMPTGANAFLFAKRNDEAVAAVSGAIALGTGLAAVSASILLYLMDSGAF
ncbi:MAG: AEC family transporter [Hyphomicrobiales bacterium]